jgi:glutathione S-transferase
MKNITLLGLTASPYQLKMQALADYSVISWRRLPDQGGTLDNLRTLARFQHAKRRRHIQRYPAAMNALDEYPAVPFYSFDNAEFFYDSSGFAKHLDDLALSRCRLLPDDPVQRFVCRLLDEAFDEFGLYMVHHNRWVTSAQTNQMGKITAAEMHSLLPSMVRQRLARKLALRQANRCPYLFSVAPEGFHAGADTAPSPPSRAGFPPTHDLLNRAWRNYLAALESILQSQDYLLGDRFTLADASAYGQLSMNLVDGRAAELLKELAPLTYKWLYMIRDGGHRESKGKTYLGENLTALLHCISSSFIPLMQQNNAAYEKALKAGKNLFNEAAFDRSESLYDGELMQQPFRSVIKTFQVNVWRELQADWAGLNQASQNNLLARFPQLEDQF